jgi:Mce-associated membrane protein
MTHAKPDDPQNPEVDETELPETEVDETELAGTEVAVEQPVRRGLDWARIVAYGVLPTIAFLLAAFAGVSKYVDTALRDDARAGTQAMETAKATTVAMLSYTPDDVDHRLDAASNLLTGNFRGQYLATIHNTVIPGAQQQQISAVTKVPAAAVVSATGHQAVVMLYLDQTVTVGSDAPTQTLSSARATLNEVNGTWLISEFALT